MLTRALYQFPGTLILAAMVLPSVGSLTDHHFAERQLGHAHLGNVGQHSHSHHDHHPHGHDDGASESPTAVYNYAGGFANGLVLSADVAMQTALLFNPSSVLLLPEYANDAFRQNYTPPLEKPPPHLL